MFERRFDKSDEIHGDIILESSNNSVKPFRPVIALNHPKNLEEFPTKEFSHFQKDIIENIEGTSKDVLRVIYPDGKLVLKLLDRKLKKILKTRVFDYSEPIDKQEVIDLDQIEFLDMNYNPSADAVQLSFKIKQTIEESTVLNTTRSFVFLNVFLTLPQKELQHYKNLVDQRSQSSNEEQMYDPVKICISNGMICIVIKELPPKSKSYDSSQCKNRQTNLLVGRRFACTFGTNRELFWINLDDLSWGYVDDLKSETDKAQQKTYNIVGCFGTKIVTADHIGIVQIIELKPQAPRESIPIEQNLPPDTKSRDECIAQSLTTFVKLDGKCKLNKFYTFVDNSGKMRIVSCLTNRDDDPIFGN